MREMSVYPIRTLKKGERLLGRGLRRTKQWRGRYGSGPSFTGLLDLVPGAAFAGSLQALRSSWVNSAVVRVRRDSDNTEEDFTAAEVEGGDLLSWANEDKITYESDFSAGVDGWLGARVAVANVDGIGGEDEVLRLTVNDTSGSRYARRLSTLIDNQDYRLKLRYYVPSTNTFKTDFSINSAGLVYSTISITTDTWTEVDIEFNSGTTATSNALWLQFPGALNDVIYFKDFEITQKTASGFVRTLYDQSLNGFDAGQASGPDQPRGINAGTLDVENGVPVMRFDGTGDVFSVAAGTMPTVLTLSLAIRVRAYTNNARIIQFGTGSNSAMLEEADFSNVIRHGLFIRTNGTNGRYTWEVPKDAFGIFTLIFDTSTFTNTQAYWNGQVLTRTIVTAPTGTFTAPTGNLINIGTAGNATDTSKINLGEFASWPTDQTANLATIVGNQAQRFGITLP
jgi:hypothetical protein